ncbi:hypothetical protein AUP68_04411 [Ilyonectria robusta]
MASSYSPVSNPQEQEAVQLIHIPEPGSPRRSFDNSVSKKITSAPEDSAISESPTIVDAVSANTTARKKTTQLTTILSGCATILLPLILLTFLGFLIWINNEPIDEYYNRYQNALTVLASAFPILFAFVLGRLFFQIACWKLENGATLGVLEQLMGSRTFGATLATHYQLRIFNLSGLALLTIWSLSPLGGQSLLRILNVESRNFNSTGYYFDNTRSFPFSGEQFFVDSAYDNALFAPSSVIEGPMDIWGNVKIPFFQGTSVGLDDEDWRELSREDTHQYSSLVGIPATNISTGNTTFSIQSSYIDLVCTPYTADLLNSCASSFFPYEIALHDTSFPFGTETGQILNGTWNGFQHNSTAEHFIDWNLALDRFVDRRWWNNSVSLGSFENETGIEAEPTHLLFQARINISACSSNDANGNNDYERVQIGRTKCRVLQKYVESRVKCSRNLHASRGECSVIAQRKSKKEQPSENLSVLSHPYSFYYLSDFFPTSISTRFPPITNPTLVYLRSGSIDDLHDRWGLLPLLQDVGSGDLSMRLSQVINTYILLSQVGFQISSGSFEARSRNSIGEVTKMETQTTDQLYVYNISWQWMVASLVSCIVLLFGGVFGVLFTHLVRGPETLGYVSTILRDSMYVDIPLGTERMEGYNLSKAIKNERFQYGGVGLSQGGVYRMGIARPEDIKKSV